ncbi:uncharacterized protein GGS22DRAFT_182450 [Annulohypoxylon maeteangense]|uniref:uncharacterized protein n=1 Tax=Annulohypoxylon maeteangense TaxID=1927788 RepID=UPI0020082B7D|nr:uncharacterized protein GGS22DRAFT_182450 [Annulohypoxylon maeteangense]KAI0880223.1 hypothetical protein GGS22DRAFT_182450 [Annulohypoxylon maeteangense]
MAGLSPLFQLPQEVRDKIYEFYLAFNHSDFEDTLRPQIVYFGDVPYSRPLPSLMLTCKSLYQELSPTVHGEAILRVEIPGWNDRRIGFGVRGNLKFDRLSKLYLLIATEHPNWNSWLSTFEAVAEHGKNIETLVIDWGPRPVESVGWSGRANLKKETEFFNAITSLKNLQILRVYGNISPRWMNRFDEIAKRAHVVRYRFRWWREPGLD